jgi:hypothetical protein
MHHLECRFDHALLRDQLKAEGINTMKPFSDFPFLKQAFTEGERWTVSRERAEKLRANGSITQEQFDEFTSKGAIGSHLKTFSAKAASKASTSMPSASSSPRPIRGNSKGISRSGAIGCVVQHEAKSSSRAAQTAKFVDINIRPLRIRPNAYTTSPSPLNGI